MRLTWLVTTLLIHRASACLSSAPRQQYQAPANSQYYYYNQQGQAPQVAAPARAAAAAANKGPTEAISSGSAAASAAASAASSAASAEAIFGRGVLLSDFSSNGYNAEGGGPVNSGAALQCDFEGRPCCWANVPSPEDQIDWQMASGVPESQRFQNVSIQGHYLVAYAASAAPSDEAQFVSCSIACASTPIRVRARHWQSENVLLQVCQRESFPNSVNFNPLLNCQEFPTTTQGIGFSELVLPKASLVDIVFVASNFIGANGDIAVLDNIELLYESDPAECATSRQNRPEGGLPIERSGDGNHVSEGAEESLKSAFRGNGFNSASGAHAEGTKAHGITTGAQAGAATAGQTSSSTHGVSTSSGGSAGSAGSSGSASSAGSAGSAASAAGQNAIGGSSSLTVHKTHERKGPINVTPEMQACERTRCTFEDGTACAYSDAYQTQSIRGLTTRFQVVRGQFMNRVTGVHEGTEGNYYAATYLYPREVAGLQADVGFLPADRRLRFQYYEGTHGVQLKGCCDTAENCPFSSDKFVTVSDRMWKYGSFVCPKGTEKFIFLCENTRTNQGACALDDIQVVENRENIMSDDQPLC